MQYCYQYPRAALTVDCVVFGFDEGKLKVLLIERALAPFKGRWALPGGFVRVEETLSELQHLYEAVLETELDKRNFRKKVLSYGLLTPVKESQRAGRHRPAQLFQFNEEKYQKLVARGFNFEL